MKLKQIFILTTIILYGADCAFLAAAIGSIVTYNNINTQPALPNLPISTPINPELD